MTLPIQLHTETSDTELILRVENMLLKDMLRDIRKLLEIPERPAEIDELYHAGRAGLLAGRMQMALNLIDSPIRPLEAEQPCD